MHKILRYTFSTLVLLCSFSVLFGQNNYRNIDGSGNNLAHPEWGQAGSMLRYHCELAYEDGTQAPTGSERPSPRLISNTLFHQDQVEPDTSGLNDLFWVFGQFIDHDIIAVPEARGDLAMIEVPPFDPYFDPGGTGGVLIPMHRSGAMANTGTGVDNPRRHANAITAWIDGSALYGSDSARAAWLRSFVGGKLKTSPGNLLPFNTTNGSFDGPIDSTAPPMDLNMPGQERYFIAGDARANEQPALIAFHTLFVREHNRLCDSLTLLHPSWTDEALYQHARRLVGGMLAAILYEEWLPALGVELPTYEGYKPETDGRIMNVFSASAFRLGHSMVNSQLLRLEADGSPHPEGPLSLREAFFNPFRIRNEGGLDPLLRGLMHQPQQRLDMHVVTDLRNFLFGRPGHGGLDLVSLNIMRGRERGLPDFNEVRRDFGLPPITTFQELTPNAEKAAHLHTIYEQVENIDPWVGMLAEAAEPGAIIGPTLVAVVAKQFHHLREGDRFYYENDPALNDEEKAYLRATRLADLLRRNTEMGEIPAHAFRTPQAQEEQFRKLTVRAFPNPVTDRLNLQLDLPTDAYVVVRISDIKGRLMDEWEWSAYAGTNRLDLSFDERYLRGLYTLVLRADGAQSVVKLIKQ